MKVFIIGILGSSLLLNGCTSFKPLEPLDKAEGGPEPGDRIRITLVDGPEIESEAYQHLDVSEPSDFVYGVGEFYKKDGRGGIPFAGRIIRSKIDSIVVEPVYIARGTRPSQKGSVTCWLSDGARAEFGRGRYFNVTPDSGTGLWCFGKLKLNGKTSDFCGRIPNERIKEIEVQKFSVGKTALVVASVAIIIVVAAVLYEPYIDLTGLRL